MEKLNDTTRVLMDTRFGHDNRIALATAEDGTPSVRTVNAYYEDGAFYVITHARSNKMRQLEKNPAAAVCGDWFTAHGIGGSIGHPQDACNIALMSKLRAAFASWYTNGHVNEADPATCILRIRLTDGVLMDHGARHEIDFT